MVGHRPSLPAAPTAGRGTRPVLGLWHGSSQVSSIVEWYVGKMSSNNITEGSCLAQNSDVALRTWSGGNGLAELEGGKHPWLQVHSLFYRA